MHEIRVSVVSAEEASFYVAELWSDGRMIGFTQFDDGDLMLRIATRRRRCRRRRRPRIGRRPRRG
jgi:hypothetical protein